MADPADSEAAAQRIRVRAPAKLNLGLRVLGRRPDGLHRLESLFVPLDLADELELEVSPAAVASVKLRLEAAGQGVDLAAVPSDGTNLAARAAALFLKAAGLDLELMIRLRKRIPVGAGLGGGSSDAGAVLRTLHGCYSTALPAGELQRLAAELGADVPFFLAPRPAVVSGIGDVVRPLEGVPPLALLLVSPGISLATAAVYEAYDAQGGALTAPRPGSTMPAISGLPADPRALADCLATRLENDLEPAALRLCPALAGLAERIRAVGALGTGLSGSGATVFGVFDDVSTARSALLRAGFEPPIWARVAESLGSEVSEGSRPGASPNW